MMLIQLAQMNLVPHQLLNIYHLVMHIYQKMQQENCSQQI